MNRLKNKVALVTGASKGIGAAIAAQFAEEGASVVVNYATSKADAERVVAEITAKGGKAVAIQGDLSKRADIAHLFAETKKAFGGLDILVNNAGIYDLLPLEAIDDEHFHKQFNLNVLGLLYASQEAVPLFSDKGGSIINISSLVSTMGNPFSAVYSGTKGAVDAITRVLAKELGPKKIRVNAINPGLVETEGVVAAGFNQGEFRKTMETLSPLGRIGRPADVAPAAVFFASDDSGWVTGETLLLSGGIA